MLSKPALTAIGTVLAATGAHAQTAPASDEPIAITTDDGARRLNQIIIRGTKQNVTVQDTDVSIELFDEERLARESLFNLDEVLLRTPGINFSGSTASLTVRGISRDGVSGGGQGVTSNVYLDGVPIATTALSFGFDSLWDVGQVEVLRGPQSTVQGRNSLAGAIVISTKDPTYDWEFGAQARYSEFDTQQYSGVISGPIIDDQLAFRVAVDYQSTDGFIDNAFADADANPNDNLLIRTKLLAEPNFAPKLRAEFIFEYTDNERGTVTPIVNAPVDVSDPAFVDFSPFDFESFDDFEVNRTDTIRAIGDITYDLTENIQLKGLGTFEDVDRIGELGDLEDLTLFTTNSFSDDTVRTFQGEISAHFNFDRFTGSVGAYYFESEEDFFLSTILPAADVAPVGVVVTPADSLISAELDEGTDTQNFAFYGQGQFKVTDRLTLAFGIRYDQEEFSTAGEGASSLVLLTPECVADVPGFIIGAPIPFATVPCDFLFPPAAPDIPQSETFDAVLPRGSITYDITEDFSVFFAAQRGFRAGGTFLQQTATDAILGTFDPEFLVNYEIGFRSQWFDRRLTLNGNLFISQLDDQQVSLPGETGGPLDFFTENAAESTIMGLEFTADYTPIDGLNFFGSLSLLDTEFDDFPFAVDGPEEGPFFNLAGNEFPLAPTLQFTVSASYEHRTGLFGDISLNYTGSTNSGVENLTEADFAAGFASLGLDPALAVGLTEESEARTLVSARLGIRREHFSLFGFVTNLFNEDATLLGNPANILPDGSFNLFDTPAFTVVQPQSFGVTLQLNY